MSGQGQFENIDLIVVSTGMKSFNPVETGDKSFVKQDRTLARLQNRKYGKVQVLATSLETEDIMPADREVESR